MMTAPKTLEIHSVQDPTEVMRTLVEQREWGLLSLMGLRVEITWADTGSVIRFTGPPHMIEAMTDMVSEWTVGEADWPPIVGHVVGEA